jgi:hypothetical protein
MTTPAGYYDAQGNFIPGSFADQLDLPAAAGVGSAAANAAQQALAAEQGVSATAQRGMTATRAELKRLQAMLDKTKKLTPAAKASLQKQIAQQKANLSTQTKNYQASQGRLPGLQTKYYEASGQFEKLLQGANRDAFASLSALFNQYGLGSLAGKIYEMAKQGLGADVITLELQNTSEYKERFAANETRRKAGLPVLSPAEYLETESAYRQILNAAGLPKGFYDSPTDFRNWIAGDVSPTEVKGRVDLAVGNTMQANTYSTQALKQLYGVDSSYITAYFLDDKKALPLLQKQSQVAAFGGEALRRGLELNPQNLEDFVTQGLSQSQVSQGFQAVAEALPNIQAIAARWGETFGQSELEQDLIAGTTGLGQARRKRLASQERGLFSGFGGATPGGLSTGFQAT